MLQYGYSMVQYGYSMVQYQYVIGIALRNVLSKI